MKEVWENPEIQSIGRLPSRSPLIPYDSADFASADAAAGPEATGQAVNSPYYKLLNGQWQFWLLDSPDGDYSGSKRGWHSPSFAADDWRTITVPGTWTLQEVGDMPHYTNVQMPFSELPPSVPKVNPTGLYRLDARISKDWKGRRVVLHIGSAESVAIVFVNGMKVGVSKDTRLPAEFDITHCIRWSPSAADRRCIEGWTEEDGGGRALIAIKVVRYSDASFMEDQDQWWFGGIHRSVYLYATEERYIEDVEALTRVEIAKGAPSKEPYSGTGDYTGIIPLKVALGYASHDGAVLTQEKAQSMKAAVKYEVHTLEGNPSHGVLGECVAKGQMAASYDYRASLNMAQEEVRIPNAKLWSHEAPNLYVVSVSLCEEAVPSLAAGDGGVTSVEAGRVIECVAFTVGFKTVSVKNRELLINGKKVYIYGVNRHEHNEYKGKTLTTKEMARDVCILKSHNFNAVRTCHYPDDEVWYELCDRYGLYVLDEANVECHGYYDCLARSDEWMASFMARAQRMVRRDKNHACIFGWSLGNESGDGANLAASSAWIKRVDPTRIVHYEGFVRPPLTQGEYTLDSLARNKDIVDLVSPMYPSIDLITKYADTREDARPLIMCEYSHAMGNANGSLADYWQAIESHHGLQGGFIWDYIDQGIAATAPNGKKYWKYGGDFGDVPTDYDFCINGLMFPDQTPKPAMEECRYLFADVRMHDVHAKQGVLEVENRRLFTDLSNVAVRYALLENGSVIESGGIRLPPVPPQTAAAVQIKMTDNWKHWGAAEVVLRTEVVYAKDTPFAAAGGLIRSDEFVLQGAQGLPDFTARDEAFAAADGANTTMAEEAVLSFTPVLFHAMTENEGIKAALPYLNDASSFENGCFCGKPTQSWLNSGLLDMKVVQKQDADASNPVREYALISPDNAREKKVFGTYTERITKAKSPDGSPALLLEGVFCLNGSADGGLDEYPRVGLQAAVPSSLDEVAWYGLGWHECYCDRKAGAKLYLHHASADDLEVPYIVPQENGARCGTRYVGLAGGGSTLHVQSLAPFSFSLSRYSVKDLFACRHTAELTDLTKGEKPCRILTIDAAHRGVGTGACGPDTLEEYRVRPGVYRLCLLVW